MDKRFKILILIELAVLVFVSAYMILNRRKPEEPQMVEPSEIIELDKIPELIEAEPEPVVEVPYTDEELELLAHLINAEAGADYCSDDLRFYVGSVALNRVNSEYFPDTLEAVIFQEGQYACTWNGSYEQEPSEASWEIAEELLIYGPVLPENVVFQAEFKQGDGVYCQEQNMYFCYKKEDERR